MGSVIDRIASLSGTLTPSESRVATYCMNHPEAVINNSINQVAKKAGVSVASVSRLALTLGYRDWKDMRLSLAKDSGSAGNPVFPEITRDDSDDGVIGKVFDGNIACLRNTLQFLDRAKIGRVVKAIGRADRVVFFGAGGSGYLAKDEALRFSHLRVAADAYTEEYIMMLNASKMRAGEIAFGFSNSGRTRSTVNVLAEARKNGALTVGIANFVNSPLEEVSDIFFLTSFPRGGEITASLTARIALLCVMDAIYVLAAQHGNISRQVAHMDVLLEENLRLKAGTRRRNVAGRK